MSNKKNSSVKNEKKKVSVPVVVTCQALFVILFMLIGLFIPNQKPDVPELDTTETETTQNETSTNATYIPSTTEKIDNESQTQPTTTKPSSTKSFYDDVKYRSPDAIPADIFKHGRNLMLLNRKYELPENFKWDLVYWGNGNSVDALYLNCEEHNSVKAVDRAAYQPLKDMFAAAEKAGVPLELVSAYRSIYLQDKLFTRSVNSFISQGYSEAEAINKANYSRTFSGTSEHNTGLGFDILQKGNYALSTSFENTKQFKWLMENAENYGFILRYAKDKTQETGIMYEPWHFRFVGVTHAKKINELGLCLEEYIEYLEA